MEWTGEFPLEPTAKGRPKASIVNGRVHMRTPSKTRRAEAEMRFWIAQSNPHHFGDAAIWVDLEFTIQRPKSVSAKKRPYPTVRVDNDNLAKGVLDSANGILWDDDKQIVDLTVRKRYGDRPSIKISVGMMEVF